jgi:hypothetical protein
MRIATFNLRNLFGPGVRDEYGTPFTVTETFVREYTEALLRAIVPLRADILIVEEVGSQKALTDLVRAMGEEYKVFFADADSRGICVALIHRVPLSTATLPDIDGLPSLLAGDEERWRGLLKNYRDLIYAKGEYGGRPLHVFGMHLKANGGMPLRDTEGKRLPLVSQRDHSDAHIRTLYYKLAEGRQVREPARLGRLAPPQLRAAPDGAQRSFSSPPPTATACAPTRREGPDQWPPPTSPSPPASPPPTCRPATSTTAARPSRSPRRRSRS